MKKTSNAKYQKLSRQRKSVYKYFHIGDSYYVGSVIEVSYALRRDYALDQHTDVMYVDAEIVRADYDANKHCASV